MTQYRMGFVTEQALGHVTHAQWLRKYVLADETIDPEFMPIDPAIHDPLRRLPKLKYNWNVVGSVRCWQRVKAAERGGPLDSLLIHTQVMAFLSRGIMRRVPTILSMDATPACIDQLGHAYMHQPDKNDRVARFKVNVNRRMFDAAARLVSFNDWAKRSLVNDYGVSPEKVHVIPQGVDLDKWKSHRTQRPHGPLRLLFVGGGYTRKGGETVVDAFRKLPPGLCELDIATRPNTGLADEGLPGLPNARVHWNLKPNSPELMRLFQNADIFVFPTLGDCSPWVILEAMAMELPVISTNVGAVDEQVQDGINGALVKPGDADALAAKIRELAQSPETCRNFGIAARQHVDANFNAAKNYPRLIRLMKEIADERKAAPTPDPGGQPQSSVPRVTPS